MPTPYDIATATLGSAVGAGGTFTVNYPAGKAADDYLGGVDHQLLSYSNPTLFARSGDFALAFGASNITVTMTSGRALANGTQVWLHLDRASLDGNAAGDLAAAVQTLQAIRVSLGRPIASDSDGIVASQNATAAGGLATGINGALAAGGTATLDVARNVVAAWTGTAVLTVTGTDEFGQAMRESSASGTSFTGKKAFKTVTGISVSADVTALTVGTSKVLGLPVFLASAAEVVRELEDDAAATAGTLVAGVTTTPSATTGDVRGTYAPNSNPDGSRLFELIALVRSPAYRGATQF